MADENRFNISSLGREDSCVIETPFPVTRNVWDFFMLEELKIIGVDSSLSPRTKSNNPAKPGELYVNRGKVQGESEIADGQEATYWGHAFLQAGERTPVNKAKQGIVFVPMQQTFYIHQIFADLGRNRNERADLLKRLEGDERCIAIQLFDACRTGRDACNESSSESFRKSIIEAISKEIDIRLNYGRIGRLPFSMPGQGNSLRGQVSLDFLRQLDSHLKPDESLNLRRYAGLTARMYSDYIQILDA